MLELVGVGRHPHLKSAFNRDILDEGSDIDFVVDDEKALRHWHAIPDQRETGCSRATAARLRTGESCP